MNNYNNHDLRKLSWNYNAEINNDEINKILKDDDFDIKLLLRPIEKSCWENAAIILKTIGYIRAEPLTFELFKWLQDINWPGALVVIELLQSYPNNIFMPYYEKSIQEAIDNNDSCWLDYLSLFVYNQKVKEDNFINKDLYKEIIKHVEQWET